MNGRIIEIEFSRKTLKSAPVLPSPAHPQHKTENLTPVEFHKNSEGETNRHLNFSHKVTFLQAKNTKWIKNCPRANLDFWCILNSAIVSVSLVCSTVVVTV